MPVVNFDASDALSFKPLEPGTYQAQISEISDVIKSQNSGAHYVWLTYEVLEEPYVGREIKTVMMLEGKGVGISVDVINAVTGSDYGFDTDEEKAETTAALQGFDLDSLLNIPVAIVLDVEEPEEGSDFPPQNRVRKVVPFTEDD